MKSYIKFTHACGCTDKHISCKDLTTFSTSTGHSISCRISVLQIFITVLSNGFLVTYLEQHIMLHEKKIKLLEITENQFKTIQETTGIRIRLCGRMRQFALLVPSINWLHSPDQMIEVQKSDYCNRVYNHLMCFDPSRSLTRCYFQFEELLSTHSMQRVPQLPIGRLMHLYTCKKEQRKPICSWTIGSCLAVQQMKAF